MTAKSYLLFASFWFFSCARGINKNTKIVKIHSQLPYSIVSERGNNSSKAEYNLAKYDTATIKRSVNPLTLNVLIADSSQILQIKPKLSPLIYLNIPNAVIGTLALGTMLRFGFEAVSLKFLTFGAVGYGGLVIDSKSNRKYTYPHHVYIYEKDKKAYFLPFDRKILAQKNALKISPFRLIDSGSPSYELAYERKLNKSFSAQYLMATMNEKPTRIGINNTFEGKRYGYELRYFLKKTAPIGPYIALDHNRLSQKFDDIINFHKKNDTLNINYSSYADTVKIFRKVNSVNIKIGYQYIKNHFVIDFGIGLGKRIETIKHEQRLNEEDVYIGNWGLFYPLTYKKKGQIQALNMPITFKLGYSF